MKDPHRYDDMLYLPHHQSATHPQMTRYNRAAQFSPFAALTGYEQVIEESGRLTDQKILLDENAKSMLDTKFQMIMEHIDEQQEYTFTFFVPDSRKDGGSYLTKTGIVKKINTTLREITLFSDSNADDFTILIDQIIDIQGDLFRTLE